MALYMQLIGWPHTCRRHKRHSGPIWFRSVCGDRTFCFYIIDARIAFNVWTMPSISLKNYSTCICDNYAKEYNITFNASKSKCMYIPPYKCRAFRLNQRPIFYIADHPLVYVNEYSHLGHIISSDSDDKSYIINRRNILCGQIYNVLCYFGRCCSVVKQRLLFTYCYSLYGSVLWDLENPIR